METGRNIINRAYLIFFFLIVFAAAVIVKIAIIQFWQDDIWTARVERLTTDLREIKPVRGNIYSADGNMLATSVLDYDIRMDMQAGGFDGEDFLAKLDTLSLSLAALFKDKPAAAYRKDLLEAYNARKRYHLVKAKATHQQVQQAREFPFWNKGRHSGGVIFEKHFHRERPFKALAGRTVGYEREGVRPVGLEGAYEADLSGRPGKRYEKRLAGGVWMPVTTANEVEPIDGSDIYSTIDIGIQDVATHALRKQLAKHRAEYGTAVLMEVETGNILAIANLGRTADSSYAEIYNYAVGAATEPGSTFKLAAVMAALEDGVLKLDDEVDTRGGEHLFYDKIMRDSNREGYGLIDLFTAFQKSSNVGISKLIDSRYRDNPREFVNRLYKLGLGSKLGLSIPGEGAPKIKDPGEPGWSGTTLPWMSIGYETLMTPLQMLTFYNAVANDGVMVKPRFVTEVRRNGRIVRKVPVEVINPAIASRQTIEQAKKLLESVVTEEGTAGNLRNDLYQIAGKTGTAQIARANLGYRYREEVSYQASFVGYFPADDPKYSCIVVVNGPSNNIYYGSWVAGPVFKEIADRVILGRMELQKKFDPVESELAVHIPISLSGHREELLTIFDRLDIPVDDVAADYPWVTTRTGRDTVKVERRSVVDGRVPNVVGMGLSDALYLLESAGLEVKVQGVGTIKRQSIPPGTPTSAYGTIIIHLS